MHILARRLFEKKKRQSVTKYIKYQIGGENRTDQFSQVVLNKINKVYGTLQTSPKRLRGPIGPDPDIDTNDDWFEPGGSPMKQTMK